MPHCSDCGMYVTRDFIRVFGVDGRVTGCPDCTTYRELNNGSAADDTGDSRTEQLEGEKRLR